MKPEKAAKIISQLPSNTASINQPQTHTSAPIRRGVGRASLRRKAPGTNP